MLHQLVTWRIKSSYGTCENRFIVEGVVSGRFLRQEVDNSVRVGESPCIEASLNWHVTVGVMILPSKSLSLI